MSSHEYKDLKENCQSFADSLDIILNNHYLNSAFCYSCIIDENEFRVLTENLWGLTQLQNKTYSPFM